MSFTSSKNASAWIALAIAVVAWAAAPVFIRALSEAYDAYTQSFVRYLAASVFLGVICERWYPGALWRGLRRPGAFGGIAVVNIVQQVLWTIGCYGVNATIAQLITKLNVVFVILFSYFLFREERRVIRHPLYLTGTLLILLGLAAVLIDSPGQFAPTFNQYTVILILVGIAWAIYAVWGKHLAVQSPPLVMFAVVSIYTTAGLLVAAVCFGDLATLASAGSKMTLIAGASGVISIAAAHPTFHYAQRWLGAAFAGSIMLLNPFITYAMARATLPGEHLLPAQWAGAVVLILGTLLVTFAHARAHGPAEPKREGLY